MKNNKNKLYITVTALVLLLLCPLSVTALNLEIDEDFENVKLSEYCISDGEYAETTKDETGNTYVRIFKRGKILQFSFPETSGKVVLDIDAFLDTASHNNAEFRIMELYDSTGTNRAYALKAGYGHTFANASSVITVKKPTDLTKWHHYQVIADCAAQTFDVYQDYELAVSNVGFNKTTNNLGALKIYVDNGVGYIDNLKIYSINNDDVDMKILDLQRKLAKCKKGYNTGQYPESAFVMAQDSIENIIEAAKDAIADEDVKMSIIEDIEQTETIFKSHIISTNSDLSIPNHITVPSKTDVPTGNCEEFGTYELRAAVHCADNSLHTNQNINYSILTAPEGVSIEDNQLIFNKDTIGAVTIKAEADNGVYNKMYINLVECSTIELTEVKVENESLIVSGKVKKTNDYDITYSIKSEYIDLSGEPHIDDSTGEFKIEYPFGATPLTQKINILFEGEGAIQTESEYMYFGEDAEDVFMNKINNATEETIEEILADFYEYAKIDVDFFADFKEDIKQSILKHKAFADIDEFNVFIKELKTITDIKNASRANIEKAIKDNIDILKSKGLSKKFDTLTNAQLESFYLKVVGLQNDNLDDLISSINKIIDTVVESKGPVKRPSGGGGGGGYVPPVDKKSTAVKVEITPATTEAETVPTDSVVEDFVDLSAAEWAAPALRYLKQKGVLNGENNYAFPNRYITRGEMAKLLVVAFEIKSDETYAFEDSLGKWWEEYASVAKANGIINGYPDGDFKGDNFITREDAATLINRCVEASKFELYEQSKEEQFADIQEISDYAVDAIYKLQRCGIVSGVGDSIFAPNRSITRAEVAQMLYKILTIK